ncbi:MAG: hypothetical protein HYS27_10600 [Deltaproteobacteria bacterium]|nr:hypothetical protein [Deltaproteobacteria bacterium]
MPSACRRFALLAAALVASAHGSAALAAPLITSGADAALDLRAERILKQFRTFNAAAFGVSLDARVADPDDQAAVRAFLLDDGALDFAAFTTAAGRPRSAREVVTAFDEHGDLGMFGGTAAAATAYRYQVLRDQGAPADVVDAARADLLRAVETFHVVLSITGFAGGLARGVGHPDDVGAQTFVPWPSTCPNAWERTDTWRTALDPAFADWVWRDNGSKDQLLGTALALGAFWDAVALDPSVDATVKQKLQDDARALGHALMEQVEVAPGEAIDLVIRDGTGCLTRFHDLNPREVVRSGQAPLVLSETSTSQNAFNAMAALAIVRTTFHVSGDAAIGAYYYDELVGRRGYPALLTSGAGRLKSMLVDLCVLGNCFVTNFSNVNMAWVAFHQLLRDESDEALRASYRAALEGELFDNDRSHCANNLPQAYFHLVRAAFVAHDAAVVDVAVAQLAAWPEAPLFERAVENCDAAELASGSCVADDGTALTLAEADSWNGSPVATSALPIGVRPSSNFMWRSDPRTVNGGGGDRLNPGGDFLLAYWLGRAMQGDTEVDANRSPVARPWPFEVDGGVVVDAGATDAGSIADGGAPADGGAGTDGGAAADAGSPTGDAGPVDDAPVGCGCGAVPAMAPLPLALAILVVTRRRRTRS